jgi:hypothetical protein
MGSGKTTKGNKGKGGGGSGSSPVFVILPRETAMDLFNALAQALVIPVDGKKGKGKGKAKGKVKGKGAKGAKGAKGPGPKTPIAQAVRKVSKGR